MQNPAQESAMTEVALALAMGFFSLMILTLISMGVEQDRSVTAKVSAIAALDLIAQAETTNSTAIKSSESDLVILFDGVNFHRSDLSVVSPETVAEIARTGSRRVILAVDPAISFEKALAARKQLSLPNLVVSPYSEQWRKVLSSKKGGSNG